MQNMYLKDVSSGDVCHTGYERDLAVTQFIYSNYKSHCFVPYTWYNARTKRSSTSAAEVLKRLSVILESKDASFVPFWCVFLFHQWLGHKGKNHRRTIGPVSLIQFFFRVTLGKDQSITLTCSTCISPCNHLVDYIYQFLYHIPQSCWVFTCMMFI